MRINTIKIFTLLLILILKSSLSIAREVLEDKKQLLKEVSVAFDALVKQNHQNDLEGNSHLNSYVINIESNNSVKGDYIEEKGFTASNTLLSKGELPLLNASIKKFNEITVKDKQAGLYVVLINNWKLLLDLKLPENTHVDELSDFKQLIHKQKQGQIDKIKNEINAVVNSKASELKRQGYLKNVYVYLYARLTTYDYKPGTKAELNPQTYYYTAFSKSQATSKKEYERISSNMLGTRSILDNFSTHYTRLNENIRRIIEAYTNKDLVILAHKAINTHVGAWYEAAGEKTITLFSLANTQQVFDYTGVISKEKERLLQQLRDEKAKVVVTDNSTASNILMSIRSELAKSKSVDVYWLHLDPNGSLQTEVFYKDSFLQATAQASAFGHVQADIKNYFDQFFTTSGPKIFRVSQLIDYLNWENKLLGSIGNLLSNAHIDRKYWDSSSSENFLTPLKSFLPEMFVLGQQNNFAMVCGVWNAVVDNLDLVRSITQAYINLKKECLKVLLDPIYASEVIKDASETISYVRSEWENIIALGSVLKDIAVSKTVDAAISAAKEEWNRLSTGNLSSIYYLTGYLIVEFIVEFYTAGVFAELKATIYSLKSVQKIIHFVKPAIELIARFRAKGTNFVNIACRKAVLILKQGGSIVLDEAGNILLKQGKDLIATITVKGKIIVYKLLANTEEVIESIDFPRGIFHIETDLGIGIPQLQFARISTGWGFRNTSDELAEITLKLKDNYKVLWAEVIKLPSDLQRSFIDDFLKNPDSDVLAKFVGNLKLIEAWKKLDNIGVDEAIRRNVDALNYIANGRTNKILVEVEEALGGHSIARHGQQLSLVEMEQRVLGNHPSMPQSRSALKFDNNSVHEDAVSQAFNHHKRDIEAHFNSGNTTYFERDFDYGSRVGEGYFNSSTRRNPTSQYVTTNKIRIAFKSDPNSPGGYIMDSAYPLYE